jgi:hypothetical protein
MSESQFQPAASFTAEELEQHRLRGLADAADDREVTIDELRDRFAPGSFGCHEALKLASVFLDTVDRHLCAHPAVLAHADWYRLASEAQTALYNLYQAIGDVHLTPVDTETPVDPEQTTNS